MVIKNLENKNKLVGIICGFFLVGCVLISVCSIWTARTMVVDAQKKVYVRCFPFSDQLGRFLVDCGSAA